MGLGMSSPAPPVLLVFPPNVAADGKPVTLWCATASTESTSPSTRLCHAVKTLRWRKPFHAEEGKTSSRVPEWVPNSMWAWRVTTTPARGWSRHLTKGSGLGIPCKVSCLTPALGSTAVWGVLRDLSACPTGSWSSSLNRVDGVDPVLRYSTFCLQVAGCLNLGLWI